LLFQSYDSAVDLTIGCKLGSFYHILMCKWQDFVLHVIAFGYVEPTVATNMRKKKDKEKRSKVK